MALDDVDVHFTSTLCGIRRWRLFGRVAHNFSSNTSAGHNNLLKCINVPLKYRFGMQSDLFEKVMKYSDSLAA